jgi:hypothetical protein
MNSINDHLGTLGSSFSRHLGTIRGRLLTTQGPATQREQLRNQWVNGESEGPVEAAWDDGYDHGYAAGLAAQ